MRQSNQINQDKKGNEKNDPSIEKIEQLRNALANLLFSSTKKSASTTPQNSDQQKQKNPSSNIKKRGKQGKNENIPPAKKTKK